VEAKRWISLGLFIPAPGLFSEIIHIYLARDLYVGAASPDADEELEIQWLPLKDAADLILRGEWNDGKTALGLWRALHHLQM
jgi:ADP-ribose pyrophosphatase